MKDDEHAVGASAFEKVDFKYDGKTFSRSFNEDIERSKEELEALKEVTMM